MVHALRNRTVSERLLRVFARLAEEHGKPVPGGTLLDIRLTQNDRASLIGSTRETVSLKLGQLVRAGFIRFDDRTLVILETISNTRSACTV